jgi:hypothetical protein
MMVDILENFEIPEFHWSKLALFERKGDASFPPSRLAGATKQKHFLPYFGLFLLHSLPFPSLSFPFSYFSYFSFLSFILLSPFSYILSHPSLIIFSPKERPLSPTAKLFAVMATWTKEVNGSFWLRTSEGK